MSDHVSFELDGVEVTVDPEPGETLLTVLRERLGAVLAARGLLLVGLDLIGGHLTEINVTSPTCFQEITDQTGFNVAQRFVDALEGKLAA